MSDLFFPTFQLMQQGRPIPFFDTNVQASVSGPEYRISRRSAVRYRIPVTLQLQESLGEDTLLFDFFEAMGGMRESFLFTDRSGRVRRVRFDADNLDDLQWESGNIYSGTIDLVTVV